MLATRFFTGHYHLGTFQTPWHEGADWVQCPFCDEELTRVHLVWGCCGVVDERKETLGALLSTHIGDWSRLTGIGAAKLGRSLRLMGLLIDRAG